MDVELAFFAGDDLLVRGRITCGAREVTEVLSGGGFEFRITHALEELSAPISIVCVRDEVRVYESALRMGVHTSEDWEAIDLGGIHELAFRCTARL